VTQEHRMLPRWVVYGLLWLVGSALTWWVWGTTVAGWFVVGSTIGWMVAGVLILGAKR